MSEANDFDAVVMPEFGSKVKFTHVLKRRMKCERSINSYGTEFFHDVKYWDRRETSGSGLYIGTRTLQNGVRDWDGEYGYTFSPTDHFTAALVVPGPRQNPIYVPMDAIEA